MSISAITIQDERFKSLGLQKTIVNKEQVCSYSRGLGAVSEDNPILVLIHGYPQSSYLWRHLIPLLPSDAPVFAADLPGYGASNPVDVNDKLTIGNILIDALRTEIKRTSSKALDSVPIVLIGHDRGARVAHRLAVSGAQGFDIRGVCLIDIVPTAVQWQASRNATEVVTYFHWPLLANVDQAFRLITAYGGPQWVEDMCRNWAGRNEAALATFHSDNAIDVYKEFFTRPETILASNRDYEAGAGVDVEMQKKDQEEGRKVRSPVLLVWSEGYIGKRYDVEAVWRDWVGEGVKIDVRALGDGVGHFGAEEAPKETAEALNAWLAGLKKE